LGNTHEALDILDAAIAQAENCGSVDDIVKLSVHASIHARGLRKSDLGLSYMKRAVHFAPADLKVLFGLSAIYYELGRLALAKETLDRCRLASIEKSDSSVCDVIDALEARLRLATI